MSSEPFEDLIYERLGHVAVITFNRPARLNAIGRKLAQEIEEAMYRAEADRKVRAVVITGAGPVFCAGGDLQEIAEARAARGRSFTFMEKTQPAPDAALLAVHEARKPVIAAVHGAAVGAGMNLALAADIRIASTTACFSQANIRRGLPPDTGGTCLLPRVVGLAKACELAFTGDAIDADEALRLGVVSRVVAPDELTSASLELAGRIAEGPPVAISLCKQSIHRGMDGSLRAALAREAAAFNACAETEDAEEGLMAFFEKREPRFQGC